MKKFDSIPPVEQKLAIHDTSGTSVHFTCADLKENLATILDQVKKDTSAKESEINELRRYVDTFTREMENGIGLRAQ